MHIIRVRGGDSQQPKPEPPADEKVYPPPEKTAQQIREEEDLDLRETEKQKAEAMKSLCEELGDHWLSLALQGNLPKNENDKPIYITPTFARECVAKLLEMDEGERQDELEKKDSIYGMPTAIASSFATKLQAYANIEDTLAQERKSKREALIQSETTIDEKDEILKLIIDATESRDKEESWVTDKLKRLPKDIIPGDDIQGPDVITHDILRAWAAKEHRNFTPEYLREDSLRVADAKYLATKLIEMHGLAKVGALDSSDTTVKEYTDLAKDAVLEANINEAQIDLDIGINEYKLKLADFLLADITGEKQEDASVLADLQKRISTISANLAGEYEVKQTELKVLLGKAVTVEANIKNYSKTNTLAEPKYLHELLQQIDKKCKLKLTADLKKPGSVPLSEKIKQNIQTLERKISTIEKYEDDLDAFEKETKDIVESVKQMVIELQKLEAEKNVVIDDLARLKTDEADAEIYSAIKIRQQKRHLAPTKPKEIITRLNALRAKIVKQNVPDAYSAILTKLDGLVPTNWQKYEDHVKNIDKEIGKREHKNPLPEMVATAKNTIEEVKKVAGAAKSTVISATPMAKEFLADLNAKAKENFDKAHPPRPQKVAGAVDPSTPVVASEPAPVAEPAADVEEIASTPIAVAAESASPAPVVTSEPIPAVTPVVEPAAPAAAGASPVSTATETPAGNLETKDSSKMKLERIFSQAIMVIYETRLTITKKDQAATELRRLWKKAENKLSKNPEDNQKFVSRFEIETENIVNEYSNSWPIKKARPYETVPTRRDAIYAPAAAPAVAPTKEAPAAVAAADVASSEPAPVATHIVKEFFEKLNKNANENFSKAHPPLPEIVLRSKKKISDVYDDAIKMIGNTNLNFETKIEAGTKLLKLREKAEKRLNKNPKVNQKVVSRFEQELRGKAGKRLNKNPDNNQNIVSEFEKEARNIVFQYTGRRPITEARRDASPELKVAAQGARVPSEGAGVATEKEVLSVGELPLMETKTDTKWKPSTATAAAAATGEVADVSGLIEINNISTPDDAKAILTELSAAGADEIRKQEFIQYLNTPDNLATFVSLINEKEEIIPLINIIQNKVEIDQATFQEVIKKLNHDFDLLIQLWQTLGKSMPAMGCPTSEIDAFVQNGIQTKIGEGRFNMLLTLLEGGQINFDQLSDSTLKIIFADSSISGFQGLRTLLNKDDGLEFAKRAKNAIEFVLKENQNNNVIATLRVMLKEVEEKLKSQESPTAPAAAPAGEATAAATADVVAAVVDTKITDESEQDKARKFWDEMILSPPTTINEIAKLKDRMSNAGVDAATLTVDIAATLVNDAVKINRDYMLGVLISVNRLIATVDLINVFSDYTLKSTVFAEMVEMKSADIESDKVKRVAKEIFLNGGFISRPFKFSRLEGQELIDPTTLTDDDIRLAIENDASASDSYFIAQLSLTNNKVLAGRLIPQLESAEPAYPKLRNGIQRALFELKSRFKDIPPTATPAKPFALSAAATASADTANIEDPEGRVAQRAAPAEPTPQPVAEAKQEPQQEPTPAEIFTRASMDGVEHISDEYLLKITAYIESLDEATLNTKAAELVTIMKKINSENDLIGFIDSLLKKQASMYEAVFAALSSREMTTVIADKLMAIATENSNFLFKNIESKLLSDIFEKVSKKYVYMVYNLYIQNELPFSKILATNGIERCLREMTNLRSLEATLKGVVPSLDAGQKDTLTNQIRRVLSIQDLDESKKNALQGILTVVEESSPEVAPTKNNTPDVMTITEEQIDKLELPVPKRVRVINIIANRMGGSESLKILAEVEDNGKNRKLVLKLPYTYGKYGETQTDLRVSWAINTIAGGSIGPKMERVTLSTDDIAKLKERYYRPNHIATQDYAFPQNDQSPIEATEYIENFNNLVLSDKVRDSKNLSEINTHINNLLAILIEHTRIGVHKHDQKMDDYIYDTAGKLLAVDWGVATFTENWRPVLQKADIESTGRKIQWAKDHLGIDMGNRALFAKNILESISGLSVSTARDNYADIIPGPVGKYIKGSQYYSQTKSEATNAMIPAEVKPYIDFYRNTTLEELQKIHNLYQMATSENQDTSTQALAQARMQYPNLDIVDLFNINGSKELDAKIQEKGNYKDAMLERIDALRKNGVESDFGKKVKEYEKTNIFNENGELRISDDAYANRLLDILRGSNWSEGDNDALRNALTHLGLGRYADVKEEVMKISSDSTQARLTKELLSFPIELLDKDIFLRSESEKFFAQLLFYALQLCTDPQDTAATTKYDDAGKSLRDTISKAIHDDAITEAEITTMVDDYLKKLGGIIKTQQSARTTPEETTK